MDLLYIHPDAIKAIDEIRDYVANFNATNIDKYGRKCWQIHIYPHVVSMQGISKLPWLGYEKAVILSHSEYVNEEVSYLDTGISTGRKEPNLKVPIGSQPNVEVFGCHLSKLVGGKLLFYEDIVPMLKTYFNSYKSDNCCDSTRYIQLLTTPRNGNSYVPLDE